MYVPKHFSVEERAHLLEVMRTYNFAIMTSMVDGAPFATHLPVLVREDGDTLVVDAHVAAANAHWRALENDGQVLLIFSGPHSYISPTIYRTDNRVPTWNYLAVHASGTARVLHDPASKLEVLGKLISHHEPAFAERFAKFETDYRDSLLKAIVGLEIRIDKLEGKFKLGQNRRSDERPGVLAEMQAGDENQRALADWTKRLA